jgi:UDP-glucose 4-epimerase
MKVLLTGGAGFIGSHVAEAYINAGFKVVIIDNLSMGKVGNLPKTARFYQADITDYRALEEIFKTERPDMINHHAAQINVRTSMDDPHGDAEVNILGGLNLLKAAREFSIKKFIFASTGGAIYDEKSPLPTPETAKEQPCSPYGISKLAFEKYLDFYQKSFGVPYIILRYANVYGPRQNSKGEAGVISIFCEKILSGKPLIINGDGEQTRDFVFVDDVAKANVLATESLLSNEIFNIGTASESSILHIVTMLRDYFTMQSVVVEHRAALSGEVFRSCLDTSSVRRLLDWHPRMNMKDGVEITAASFEKMN